ncbi:conserved exported hypothetical protein [Gammaproteobacteria bacterium]
MRKLFMSTVLMLSLSIPALGAEPQNTRGLSENFNKNLAMLGAGVLGVVLASGTVGLISSSTMMYEGAGFAEAMESGAGLSLPLVLLSAVLGGVFGQDFVQRNIHALNASGEPIH